MTHGKQRNWPDSAVAELVEMIDRLTVYLRLGGVEEMDGEFEDARRADDLLRRYRSALSETSLHASADRL